MTDARISPEPNAADRAAVLRAIEALARREEERATPSAWSLGGWIHRRVGLTDIARWIEPGRRWSLSTRLPAGGREHPSLHGRGDAK